MLTLLDTTLPQFLQNPWSWIIIAGFVFLLMAFARGQVTIFSLIVELQPGMRVASGIVSGVLIVIGTAGLIGLINPDLITPDTPESLYRSGKQALASGGRAAALKKFDSSRKMLAINPCDEMQIQEWWSDLYFQLSSLETSDRPAASRDVSSSLCLNPDNQEAQRTLKYLDNGDPNRAATDLLALGDKLAHSGNQDRANKLYILVTKMSNEPQGYLEVGRRFNQQGQFEEAARLLGKGDEESEGNEGYKTTRAFINKEWGVALFNLHRCNDAEIKLHRAADLFKELNESDPTVTNLLKGAGHGC